MRMQWDQAALKRLDREAGQQALLRYAEEIRDDAQDYAPVVSGDLQASIEIDDAETGRVYIGSELPYTAPIELGSTKDGSWVRAAGEARMLRDALFQDRD